MIRPGPTKHSLATSRSSTASIVSGAPQSQPCPSDQVALIRKAKAAAAPSVVKSAFRRRAKSIRMPNSKRLIRVLYPRVQAVAKGQLGVKRERAITIGLIQEGVEVEVIEHIAAFQSEVEVHIGELVVVE